MNKIFGYTGAFLLSICGLPQAYQSYITKSSEGISGYFLTLWLLGEICFTIYILPKKDIPLLLNYFFNIFLICVIIYYKI
jgi:uncharacterized protein with PQ loop repeat